MKIRGLLNWVATGCAGLLLASSGCAAEELGCQSIQFRKSDNVESRFLPAVEDLLDSLEYRSHDLLGIRKGSDCEVFISIDGLHNGGHSYSVQVKTNSGTKKVLAAERAALFSGRRDILIDEIFSNLFVVIDLAESDKEYTNWSSEEAQKFVCGKLSLADGPNSDYEKFISKVRARRNSIFAYEGISNAGRQPFSFCSDVCRLFDGAGIRWVMQERQDLEDSLLLLGEETLKAIRERRGLQKRQSYAFGLVNMTDPIAVEKHDYMNKVHVREHDISYLDKHNNRVYMSIHKYIFVGENDSSNLLVGRLSIKKDGGSGPYVRKPRCTNSYPLISTYLSKFWSSETATKADAGC
jgi:hypothetical protein